MFTAHLEGNVINWQRWLPKRSRALLCIDLSATHLTVLQVEQSMGQTPKISGFYREPLPPGAVVERQIVEFEPLLAQLRDALQLLPAGAVRAAIAVPTATAISKQLEMPADFSEAEIEELLGFEIEQHIPYPAEEICWDFQRLALAEGLLARVHLVACRREYVEARAALISAAGLTPVLVDVENFALQRAFALLSHQLPASAQVVALVDVGEHSLTLTVMLRSELLYNREKPRASGGGETLQPLVEQIGRELQFFYASSPYNIVDQLLLSGLAAGDPDLLRALRDSTRLECQLADPLPALTVAESVDEEQLQSHRYLLLAAIGLAVGSEHW